MQQTTMASLKRKVITRDQLVQMSTKNSNGKLLRRSPRGNSSATPNTISHPNARRSLFSKNGVTTVHSNAGTSTENSCAEKLAIKRWSMLLNSMSQHKELQISPCCDPGNPQKENISNQNGSRDQNVPSSSMHLGREPYDWAMKTMNAAWRLQKCELKIRYFDGRTHEEAIAQRALQVPYIPENMWKNLVEFWESPKGEERSKRNIENRSKSMMCHYAGSKSFARIRAEKKEKEGKEPDPLDVWLETHEPKQGSRLDNASATVKKAIQEDLARLPQSSSPCAYEEQRLAIFRKYVGEDKNGYAKTFGLGVKVPRSRTKRCALEEDRAKRIEGEMKVQKVERKLDKMTNLMTKFLQLQGMSKEEILILLEDEEDGENAKDEENAGSECNDENEKDNDDFNDYGGEERDYHAQNDEDMEFYDYD